MAKKKARPAAKVAGRTKKAARKKAVPKKAARKTSVLKKAAPGKSPTKKAAPKKPASRKPVLRKAALTKPALKKSVSKKATVRHEAASVGEASPAPSLQDALKKARKSGKAPPWAKPKHLPPILVEGGRLTDDQVELLVSSLISSKLAKPSPLVAAVKKHAVPTSRDAFAVKLLEAWKEAGEPKEERWALVACGLLGDDFAARSLTPCILVWPSRREHNRAKLGMECLQAIGTDGAMMQLLELRRKLRNRRMRLKADEMFEGLAARRGVTAEDAEDIAVPSGGLDARGRRTFDFGPRQFTLSFDLEGNPCFRDAEGRAIADLPRPNRHDDPVLAKPAEAEWKSLKKLFREVQKVQGRRFEIAMIESRRWKPEVFWERIGRHPLLSTLARRVLWATYNPDGRRGPLFRWTDEGDAADVHDSAMDLGQAALVGIVHPLELTDDEIRLWGERFSDYEVVQPFAQLSRVVYRLEQEDLKGDSLPAASGVAMPCASLVFGLERRGWLRGEAVDNAMVERHTRWFARANITAILLYKAGFVVFHSGSTHLLEVGTVKFYRGRIERQSDDLPKAMRLDEVPPILASEVMLDLDNCKPRKA